MTHRHNGVPLHELFDPDIMGDGPAAPGFRESNVPLKFASIAHGSKGPDVKKRSGGVDISNLWAAAGTAVYVSLDAFPELIESIAEGSSAPVTSSSGFTFLRNGTFTTVPSGGGSWGPSAVDTGDAYDLRITKVAGSNSVGTMTGILADPSAGPVQIQLNAARTILVEHVKTTVGSTRARRVLLIELVRRADSAVVDSITMNVEAEATIS